MICKSDAGGVRRKRPMDIYTQLCP